MVPGYLNYIMLYGSSDYLQYNTLSV